VTRPLASAALVALSLFAPLGCIRGTIPARELYRIAAVPADSTVPQATDGATPLAGSLGIAPYLTAGIYAEPSIAYRIGDAEYGTYPSREWALPLSQMLGVLTEELVRRHPLTAEDAVYSPPSLRSQTYLWRGRVRRFEEVDRGKVVSAAVWVDAVILRTSDDSVLWSGSAQRERPVSGNTMADVVHMLSTLASEAVQELVINAGRSLPRRSAASAGGPE